MKQQIIWTDATYFIAAIAAASTGAMHDTAFDIIQEWKKANEKEPTNLGTISQDYTLATVNFADPKYCHAIKIAARYLEQLAHDNATWRAA